jgi:hypothetical protein
MTRSERPKSTGRDPALLLDELRLSSVMGHIGLPPSAPQSDRVAPTENCCWINAPRGIVLQFPCTFFDSLTVASSDRWNHFPSQLIIAFLFGDISEETIQVAPAFPIVCPREHSREDTCCEVAIKNGLSGHGAYHNWTYRHID